MAKTATLSTLFIMLWTLQTDCQVSEDPYSPCPKVFHYETTNDYSDTLSALLTVPFPMDSSVIHTSLIMTVQGHYEGYKGELQLTRNKSEVISDIKKHRIDVVQFQVHLPRLEPWPILGVVLVNQIVICMGPMILPVDESVLTSLTLNYVLHLTSNSSHPSKPISTTHKPTHLPSPDTFKTNRLQDLVNTSEVQVLRSYLEEIREGDATPSPPKLDLRIDTKDRNQTHDNQGRNCTSYRRSYYPWIVAVYIKSGLGVQYHCTANLISSQHVILAGHCIQESRGSFIPAHQLILFFGKTVLSSWEDHVQTREISEVLVHPQFDHFSYTSDLAILKFSSPIEFSARVSPICIWTPEDTSTRVGIVVGWGMNPKTQSFTPNILRPAIVQLIPWELCIQDRDLFYITSHTTLCGISVDGTGPCNGDSGAGLVILDPKSNVWYLRALVSLAMVDKHTQKCDLNRSVVLTNVHKYQAWIEETLNL
ncbi:hypothetical protein M8J75_007832 [Diaphorina citri]|nr:hypothetical protein M8J75_007832 [Diaphorina citri]